MEYCKKAYKVSEFNVRMLHKKESLVMSYFQTHDLIIEWDNVRKMYKEEWFGKVSPAWAKKAKEIKDYIEVLPIRY